MCLATGVFLCFLFLPGFVNLEEYHRFSVEAEDVRFFVERGNYFYEQEQYTSALLHYRFARSIEPRLDENFIFRFRLAYCCRETGLFSEALTLLRPLEKNSLIGDYVLYQLAACYAALPDSQAQAIRYFRRLIGEYSGSVFLIEAALQLAELYAEKGRGDEMRRTLALAQSAMNKELTLRRLYEPRSIYLRGRLAVQQKQTRRALNYFRLLTGTYRHSDEALQARLWIKKLTQTTAHPMTTDLFLELNQVLVLQGHYADAITELKGYEGAVTEKEQTAVAFQLARIYAAMGRYEEAARRFERLWKLRKHKESLLHLARVSRYRNDPEQAIRAFRVLLMDTEKNSLWLNYIRFELANTLAAVGDSAGLSEAIALYRLVRDPVSGSGYYAPGATFREAFIYYRLGYYDSALTLWSQMEERFPAQKNRARFWKAKCYSRMGKSDQANLMFRQLAVYRMTDYYGMLSELLYHNPSSVTPRRLFYAAGIPLMRLKPDETANGFPVYEEFHHLTGLTDRDLRKAFGKVILAGQLMGPRWAEAELAPIRDQMRSSFNGILAVKKLAELLGCHNIAVDAGVILRKYYENQLTTDELNRLHYPVYYAGAVQLYARQYGLDPALLFAVIKSESAFRSRAISPARALGLMQIMPFTGRSIAEELQISDFKIRQLQSPEINIRMGGYYLNRQAKAFKGYIPAMLAAYNAGPHRTVFWMRFYDEQEPEAFPEMVDFAETHAYIKKILHDRWIYSLIYTPESS